jgi:acyl-CoA thioesterase-1
MKMPVNYGKDYREQYEAVYAGLGQRDSLIYVPFLLDGVGGVKELNQADAIHPNEKGHKKIAENLWAQLQNKAFFLSLKQPANRSPKDEGQK